MSDGNVLIATPEEAGMRVDAWIAVRYRTLAKRTLRKWLEDGQLLRQGKPCSKGDRILPGEAYTLRSEPTQATLQPNSGIPVDVVYEDDALLAVNKPAGLDCQPNQADETDTLATAVLARYPALEGIGDTALTCGILHRIDGDTSGLVLVAKSQAVYEDLRRQFAERQVEKHYRALVLGSLTTSGRLEHWLAHNPRCPGRMVDASLWRDVKRPMYAETAYR
ncbi:MAG: RluA family pseudouridine synthase, partial [Kiritimatiellae bacterium]|nr:RluA family pseudouridine synthase [Kiritimatiellia bacterium]